MRRLKSGLPGDWVGDALCREVGSDNFFPPDDKPVARDFYRRAKTICARCTVLEQCLTYGLDEPYGVWGGTSPTERREMRDHSRRRKQFAEQLLVADRSRASQTPIPVATVIPLVRQRRSQDLV